MRTAASAASAADRPTPSTGGLQVSIAGLTEERPVRSLTTATSAPPASMSDVAP